MNTAFITNFPEELFDNFFLEKMNGVGIEIDTSKATTLDGKVAFMSSSRTKSKEEIKTEITSHINLANEASRA